MVTSGVPVNPAAGSDGSPASPVTEWLLKWSNGDVDALNRFIPLLYSELCRLAKAYFRNSSPDQTLSPTDLVHEAYLRLAKLEAGHIQSRAHFYAVAAHVMRSVLVDRTRRRYAAKRHGNLMRVSAEELDGVAQPRDLDLIALDDALKDLAGIDPLKCQIVELRFFGGLSMEDVASAMDLSARTVARHWVLAKAWLYTEIERGGRL